MIPHTPVGAILLGCAITMACLFAVPAIEEWRKTDKDEPHGLAFVRQCWKDGGELADYYMEGGKKGYMCVTPNHIQQMSEETNRHLDQLAQKIRIQREIEIEKAAAREEARK